MSPVPSKEELRAVFSSPANSEISTAQGKLAEKVRRIPGYKQSRQMFVEPGHFLLQTRINALLDGKELIMPAAGLKEGFYLLEPFTIPFKKLSGGVSYKGLADHGRKLLPDEIASLDVSFMISDPLAADGKGWRLGDGEGFFDLSVAILNEMGGLSNECRLVSAIPGATNLVDEIPHDPWDVRCDVVITPETIFETNLPPMLSEIKWEALTRQRIKRITPLWKLSELRK